MSTAAAMAHSGWLATSLPGWLHFRNALRYPEQTQDNILRGLLQKNASCSYGQIHSFRTIQCYKEFRDKIPLVRYEDLEPWIAKIQQGSPGILTMEPITHFVPTSGSSGARKLIPFTAGLQQEFNAAISPWMVDLFWSNPSLISCSTYWSISPAIPNVDNEVGCVPIGFEDDSQYLGGIRRKLAEATFAVPSAVRMVNNNLSFRYLTLLSLLRHSDLGLISIWHPSFLGLLLGSLSEWWEELLQDVDSGRCNRAQYLGSELRNAMLSQPLPRRCQLLSSVGPEKIRAIWPRLQVVSCWGDAHAQPAMHDLSKRCPGITLQAKGLLSTEAFISLPFRGQHPLAVTSHFYEFLHNSGKIYRAHELKLGETYSVVVSTSGGLWRYQLGDLVEVDGFVEQTPSLKFVGREGSVLDYCGEKLSEAFVTQAIESACAMHRFSPLFAMLAPDLNSGGTRCYTFFVEGPLPNSFTVTLDARLKANSHYRLCCNLGQLGRLRCFKITDKGQALFLETNVLRGHRLGEIKPTALSRFDAWREIFPGDYEV